MPEGRGNAGEYEVIAVEYENRSGSLRVTLRCISNPERCDISLTNPPPLSVLPGGDLAVGARFRRPDTW